jgi:sensor histidine kinase YesM
MLQNSIYIVEDSIITSHHLSVILKNEGYSIAGISTSGEDALKEIEERKPDMVLMDIMLAGEMNGIETAAKINDRFSIPIIYITALSDKNTIQNAKMTMPCGYLIKPFDEREILTIIEMSLYKAAHERKMREVNINDLMKDKESATLNQQLAELRLDALQSAMNPHFIFNALNAVQFFIAKQDRVNAMTYLSTFSKLLRSLVSHSSQNRVKLKDELEMLDYYVELEQLRFENKFTFNCLVQPQMDLENIEIPAFLIHPYIANAILHGLSFKNGSGNLTLRMYEENKQLIFIIEDDGIGRDAARKMAKSLPRPDTSMVSEDRMRLIHTNSHATVEITDLCGPIGNTGTRVLISLPLSVKSITL